MDINYYYVIETNINNKTFKETFRQFDLFNNTDLVVFSSPGCGDYQNCLGIIADSLDEKIDIMNKANDDKDFKMFWEKNMFKVNDKDDKDEYWLHNEVIKINISDTNNKNVNWIFRARMFFIQDHIEFNDHLTVQ